MTADILREKFLDFFKAKKHKIVPSDSLIPKDDPTVLFTPAGMNQFKREFLGFDAGFRRAATAQRCLRTDDLDKVGKTCGHHTFFEMLGNFSFGDYFKEEAIAWAWEFLTAQLKISRHLLWVSVYRDDQESYRIWKDKIEIPEDRIVKLGDKENFWPSEAKEKGPNGPCGPCSEIFFDFGSKTGCGRAACNPGCGCGRFVEVWNLVFTQFNRQDNGVLEPLPSKNIDTGMGLERLAAVVEGVQSNFETDLFKPLIKEITNYPLSTKPACRSGRNSELIYAVADHIRAVTFAVYDGVLPSNEGRGYIVRKIIRKSILNGRGIGIDKPFLYRLVPVVAEVMKKPYPELSDRQENIAEVILAEEKGFIQALNSSEALFKDKFSQLLKKGSPEEAGRIAFQLHDTYGMPLDLTKSWLGKHDIKFSQAAFDKELEAQKRRSKSQSAMKGSVFADQALNLGIKETKFTGYQEYSSRAKIIKILKDNQPVTKIKEGECATVILDKTPFYPESGGQTGDAGELKKGRSVFQVLATQKSGRVILHIGRLKSGNFKNNDALSAGINSERRLAIARNHTATHLLQAALRKVLGPHVQQQGSFVGEEKLRFDFRHFKDIDQEQLGRIEELVNGYVIGNYQLSVKDMPLAQARKTGALAFFGEKYEGRVRVVSAGDFSKELCAGTHLEATGQIGYFKITQEGSVASGIRRIEAVTGKAAYKVIKEEEALLNELSLALNAPPQNLTGELEKRLSRLKELEKQLGSQKLGLVKASVDTLINGAEMVKGIKIITKVMDEPDVNLLRKNIDLIKEKTDNSVIALGAGASGRAFLVLGVTRDLCDKGLDASALIRQVARVIGGSGGGRQDFAQAGGDKPQNFPAAFQELKDIIGNLP